MLGGGVATIYFDGPAYQQCLQYIGAGGGSSSAMAMGQAGVLPILAGSIVPGSIVVPAPAPQVSMSVTVPPGVSPGSILLIQTPSGQQVQIAVPQGVVSGMAFQVQVPAAATQVPTAAVVTDATYVA